ncbi:endonuclease 8-like 3 [Corythoichthys intestinalis]|uniref:endonuclease 8-like 3 n=1 Tax=Corythoichthys intestinalis TaxID=161448 RepID=UPI0025A61401|nr:endonuclease 8-like 3 [Corythoichthys intestinalis]XP_061793555.1 endonuclease 8-like 3 [Nerophis lumbriciformis]
MVEGPGCTLNGEKIRSRVQKGQKVKEMRGSMFSTKGNDQERNNAIQRLKGCQYTGVDTLGKELFLYFGPKALRVHFGMNGSMRINSTEKKRGGSSPVLEIHLTKDTVFFFDSTVEMRLSDDCEQRLRALQPLDVCSPAFIPSRSAEAARRHGGRMLCDVLLDQAVMPGVGNIIKNEALFDAGLHPAVKVEQLSDEQLHHLVKMTRDFTLLFYKCRKSGSALCTHYKVYKRPRCGRCSGAVTVCRLGDNGRMTYFCDRCQKYDASSVHVSQLPVRNTLIGWVGSGEAANENVAKKEEEDWACHLCTLINRPNAKSCDACLSPRAQVHKDETSTHSSTDLVRYPCNTFTKPREERKLNWRSVLGTSTLLFSDLSAASGPSRGGPPASSSQPRKKMRIDGGPSNKLSVQTSAGAQPGPCRPPSCASHGRPAHMRVVHKDGDNKGRRFYTCSLPRETKCDFFEWADLHFPSCHHGKRCVMRTVLKLGPNNGRDFYTCGLQKGKQCDYFQWAEGGPGVSMLSGC